MLDGIPNRLPSVANPPACNVSRRDTPSQFRRSDPSIRNMATGLSKVIEEGLGRSVYYKRITTPVLSHL